MINNPVLLGNSSDSSGGGQGGISGQILPQQSTLNVVLHAHDESGTPQPVKSRDGVLNTGPVSDLFAPLSASTNGRGIGVHATVDPGTLLHSAPADSNSFDQVYLWACNTSNAGVVLTLEFGGNSNPSDYIVVALPAQSGQVDVCLGQLLGGGLPIRAFATVADVVSIQGYVSRKRA